MSSRSLKFNSNNQTAITTENSLTDLSGTYNTITVPTIPSTINSVITSNRTIYSNLLKNLKFFSNGAIERTHLGTVLNNMRIESIYNVWPTISIDGNNNINTVLLDCSNTSFSTNNSAVLSGNFTINFLNRGESYKIDSTLLPNTSLSNYFFFVYNLKNETITITENNPIDVTLKPFTSVDISLSHKFVNLIKLTNENSNLILIDGTSIEPVYRNLPRITISNNSSSNTSILLRKCNDVSFNYSQTTFSNSFSIDFTRNGVSQPSYKVHSNDISNNNLFIYVYYMDSMNIGFSAYNTSYKSPEISTSGQINGLVNILNYSDYSIIVIDGMYAKHSNQSNTEDILNPYKFLIEGNNNMNRSVIDSSNSSINLV